jgi:ABC-type Zn uptake system ZnuABC Zn-binding protein ZnuA
MPRRSFVSTIALASVLTLLGAGIVGCAPERTGEGAIRVVASTSLLADLAKNVARERAGVESVAPAGVSVEDFAPRPEDARRVAEADVIFVNGLDLDAWMEDLLRNKKEKAAVVTLTEGLPTIEDNPHMWFDVKLAKSYVGRIRDALSAADPDGRATYERSATVYLATLDSLDAEIRSAVERVPAERRKLVTSHDAFPYFARAYGFTVVGFVTAQPGAEPSVAELAELVEEVKAEKVPAIFAEAQVSPRLEETLAREAGVRTVVTDLVTDSLGKPPADSYVGLMRFDVQRIVEALR